MPYPILSPFLVSLSINAAGSPHPKTLLDTATIKIPAKNIQFTSKNNPIFTCAPIIAKNNGSAITLSLPMNSRTCDASLEPARPIPAANAPTIGLSPTINDNAENPNAAPRAAPCFVPLTSIEDGLAIAIPLIIFGSINTATNKSANHSPTFSNSVIVTSSIVGVA